MIVVIPVTLIQPVTKVMKVAMTRILIMTIAMIMTNEIYRIIMMIVNPSPLHNFQFVWFSWLLLDSIVIFS